MTQQVLLDLVEALRQRRDERDGGVLAKALNSRAEWTGYPEQTAIEQSWGWTSIKLYVSWSIQQTLIDRIARLREEIEQDFGRAIERYRDIARNIHTPDYNNIFCRSISGVIELQNRHDELCYWLLHQNSRNNTIICFSDDPTDLDSYGLGYCNTYDGRWGEVAQCSDLFEEWHNRNPCEVEGFSDATLWDYAAETPGSNRYYIAFQNEKDAARFRSECSPLILWKDVPRPVPLTPTQLESAAPFEH